MKLNVEDKMFEQVEVSDNLISLVYSKPLSHVIDASETVSITCIALPTELIFVDCGCYPEVVRKFRLDMETKFQRKTSHLLLTHTHWDHVIAMDEFRDVHIVCSKAGLQGIKNIIKMIDDKGPK
ncbi:MAG: MBL fold metallo-hydrolase, partial [Candidatus Hermodarchaeota archaeon]